MRIIFADKATRQHQCLGGDFLLESSAQLSGCDAYKARSLRERIHNINILRLLCEEFILSKGSPLTHKIMSWQHFPWRYWGMVMGDQARINGPVRVVDRLPKAVGHHFMAVGTLVLGGRLTVGNHVAVNHNVFIVGNEEYDIKIGNDVLIGPNVVLRSADHVFDDAKKPIRVQGHKKGHITIDDDVWIAANSVILKNVHIGKGAVIAAGAVVNKDVPPGAIVGGIPGKVIGWRDPAPSS